MGGIQPVKLLKFFFIALNFSVFVKVRELFEEMKYAGLRVWVYISLDSCIMSTLSFSSALLLSQSQHLVS